MQQLPIMLSLAHIKCLHFVVYLHSPHNSPSHIARHYCKFRCWVIKMFFSLNAKFLSMRCVYIVSDGESLGLMGLCCLFLSIKKTRNVVTSLCIVFFVLVYTRTTWLPWNLSFRYIHCTGQFTPKMNWLWCCSVTASFGVFFSWNKM